MRVLLDECLPRRLKTAISGHDVSTVPDMGWAGLPDRAILDTAAAHFDVFITVDRTMQGQRPGRLAVIVLIAPSNRLSDLLPLAPKIRHELEAIQPGQIVRLTKAVPESS